MHVNQRFIYRFARLNKEYWSMHSEQNASSVSTGGICCMHGSWCEFGDYIALQGIIAKKIQSDEKLPILSVTIGNDYTVSEIDRSFGALTYNLKNIWISEYHKIMIRIYAFVIILFCTGKGLLRTRYRHVKLGDLFFDCIQRNRKMTYGIYDMRRLKFDLDYDYLVYLLSIAERSYIYLRTNKPKYIISKEIQNVPGIFVMMGLIYGAKIVCNFSPGVYGNRIPVISKNKNIYRTYKHANVLFTLESEALKVFHGDMPDSESLFIVSDETGHDASVMEIKNSLGIDNANKTVLILPHCLGDSPQIASNRHIYTDYYNWLIDTLEIASGIHDVNWVLKDHPHSKAYNQPKFLEDIYKEYKKKNSNIYFAKGDITGDTLKNIADAVIVDIGDAGCEYVAYGIPAITTGKSYYSQFGVSINVRSRREYKNILRNIQSVESPSYEEISLAQKLIYIKKNSFSVEENCNELVELSKKYRRKFLAQLRKNPTWAIDNSSYYSELDDLLENGTLYTGSEFKFVDVYN